MRSTGIPLLIAYFKPRRVYSKHLGVGGASVGRNVVQLAIDKNAASNMHTLVIVLDVFVRIDVHLEQIIAQAGHGDM
jgi:hypothetical protein